jgi:hypothetical protein
MKTVLDEIIEDEVFGPRNGEVGEIWFERESFTSAYPGVSCVTPGDPYVLHCFPPFTTELTKEHHDHLDIIADKIRQSFSTLQPITKVTIVGHSSKWHAESSSNLERRAYERASNVHEQLILRLQRIGLANRVEVAAPVGRSASEDWMRKPYSSTSGTQRAQNDRALNRRVEVFLVASKRKPKPADVKRRDGPGIASSCGGYPVRTALHAATTYAKLASQRLNFLSSLPGREQEKQWNAGPERTWFGAYKGKRLLNVRNRMWKIVQRLESPLLVINCKWSKSFLGLASPGIPTITLGGGWRDLPSDHVKKTQTFVHEAAHIERAVLGGDNIKKFYGVVAARERADRHPGVAIRTAENIGYYAVCRASNAYDCP